MRSLIWGFPIFYIFLSLIFLSFASCSSPTSIEKSGGADEDTFEATIDDNDDDGVLDKDDDCPEIAVASADDSDENGCDDENDTDGVGLTDEEEVDLGTDPSKADTDGDQVEDGEDACPTEEADDDADGDGCEDEGEEDSDGDGVPDTDDSCPDEAATTDADSDGCEDASSDPEDLTACMSGEDADGCEDEILDPPTNLEACMSSLDSETYTNGYGATALSWAGVEGIRYYVLLLDYYYNSDWIYQYWLIDIYESEWTLETTDFITDANISENFSWTTSNGYYQCAFSSEGGYINCYLDDIYFDSYVVDSDIYEAYHYLYIYGADSEGNIQTDYSYAGIPGMDNLEDCAQF
jgi:hypothetical protein